MRRIGRMLGLATFLIVSLVGGLSTWASPASAGIPPGFIFISFYDEGWSNWIDVEDFDLVDLTEATAIIIGFPSIGVPAETCFVFTQPLGTERDYRFDVNAQDCVNAGSVGPTEALPLAAFFWLPISNGGLDFSHLCWDVRGTASTEGRFDSQIRFEGFSFTGAVATSSVESAITSIVAELGALRSLNRSSETTRSRLDGIPYVLYYLEIDPVGGTPDGGFSQADLVWTVHISIRRCGVETNTALLEHYRQIAGEAEESALPSTR